MYKSKEIKQMSFDCFHKTGEYMDHWKMSFSDLSNFLADCEYMFERKWEPIFLGGNAYEKPSDAYLCHIVNTLYKHNYITCFTGELGREFNGTLTGHSTLLDYTQHSDYKERQRKKQQKWLKEKKQSQVK